MIGSRFFHREDGRTGGPRGENFLGSQLTTTHGNCAVDVVRREAQTTRNLPSSRPPCKKISGRALPCPERVA